MTLTELYKNLGSVENARNILAYRNENQPTATHFMHHPINPKWIQMFDRDQRKPDFPQLIYRFYELEKILEAIDSSFCTTESIKLLSIKILELEEFDHFKVNTTHVKHGFDHARFQLNLGYEIYSSKCLYVYAVRNFGLMATPKEITEAIDFIQKVLDKDYEFSPDHWDRFVESNFRDWTF